MRLADLQTFLEIVEAGGLTQAAHRLGVSQPALSRTLREIETRTGAELLRRTGRGVEPTPAGDAFAAFARETLAAWQATRRAILERADSLPGTLTLSVPLRLGRLLIPGLLREAGHRLPETTLHVFEEATDRATELLDDGRIDAAVVYGPPGGAAPGFLPLHAEALFAVGTGAALGEPDAPLPLADLASLPLLVPSRGRYRRLVEQSFASRRLAPRIARELETSEALLAFAAEGEGVAILPMSNVYQEAARGEVIARPIVLPEIIRTIGLQPGRTMSRNTLRVVLPTIRQALAGVAHIARWRRAPAPPRAPAAGDDAA